MLSREAHSWLGHSNSLAIIDIEYSSRVKVNNYCLVYVPFLNSKFIYADVTHSF